MDEELLWTTNMEGTGRSRLGKIGEEQVVKELVTSYEIGEYTVIMIVLDCMIDPLSELRETRVSLNVR